MISKLRKRIFWIIQISLTIIILGVIVLFAAASYRNTITSSTMLMDRIDGRNEGKDDFRKDKPEEQNEPGTDSEININNMPMMNNDPFETTMDGVYRLEVNNNQVIRESNDVTDEIRDYAIKVSNKKSDEGYIGNYIYKIRQVGNNGKEITLMENEAAITRLKTTVILAIVVGFLGMVLICIIAKKIAKTIVKPVEETFEKQKQFISDASHELKTPLAVIEANADVLQDKNGDNKWLGYIQNEVQSMNKLVNDLLTLAKVENTSTRNYQKFDLSKEVQMATSVFESMIFEKRIELETNIIDGISFNGDREDIKHLVSILLDNAIKHTMEGKKIIVSAQNEKGEIRIVVKNQGEPIPIEEQDRIFERFYRADKARSRSEKRYGLGLAIAKEIVSKYNGSIGVNSKDGYTSFIVKLSNK